VSLTFAHLQSVGVDKGTSSWLRLYPTAKLGEHSLATMLCLSGAPQWLVLGPLLFTAYVLPVGDLIKSFSVSYYQFTDDTQLLVAMNAHNAVPALTRLANYFDAVQSWFLSGFNTALVSIQHFHA